jgi:AcrR family transcriptional regulator
LRRPPSVRREPAARASRRTRTARGAGGYGVSALVRERILRAAERLFAEHGMSGVGLRAITAAAKVNIAAISYHFGSKEGLLQELIAARAAPIVHERMRLLDLVEAKFGPVAPIERILEAFLRPALAPDREAATASHAFGRLRVRLITEPERFSRRVLAKEFDHSSRRFIEAIARAVPDVPRPVLEWRFHFTLGTMIYTMANSGRIQALTDGRCDPGDVEFALQQMIPFLAVGFRSAPAPLKTQMTRSHGHRQQGATE